MRIPNTLSVSMLGCTRKSRHAAQDHALNPRYSCVDSVIALPFGSVCGSPNLTTVRVIRLRVVIGGAGYIGLDAKKLPATHKPYLPLWTTDRASNTVVCKEQLSHHNAGQDVLSEMEDPGPGARILQLAEELNKYCREGTKGPARTAEEGFAICRAELRTMLTQSSTSQSSSISAGALRGLNDILYAELEQMWDTQLPNVLEQTTQPKPQPKAWFTSLEV